MIPGTYRPYTSGYGVVRRVTPLSRLVQPGGDYGSAYSSPEGHMTGPRPPLQVHPVAGGGAPGPHTVNAGGSGASAGGQGPSGSGPPGSGDYTNDPVYQQIIALANANVAGAEAQATAARKQVAIQLGDPGLAQKLGLGQLVADTAQANPFSTLKNLLRGHNSNATAIDQHDNTANLYHSSTRARQQLLEQTGYQGNIASAETGTQNQLAQIAEALLAARIAAATQKANAATDAYGRHKGDVPTDQQMADYYLHNPHAIPDTGAPGLSPTTILRLFGG